MLRWETHNHDVLDLHFNIADQNRLLFYNKYLMHWPIRHFVQPEATVLVHLQAMRVNDTIWVVKIISLHNCLSLIIAGS